MNYYEMISDEINRLREKERRKILLVKKIIFCTEISTEVNELI